MMNKPLQDLYSALKEKMGIKYILTRRLNQDVLEHIFAHIRMTGGLHDRNQGRIYEKGYDYITKFPSYQNVKPPLRRIRREAQGTSVDPKHSDEIRFSDSILALPKQESFLRLDFKTNDNFWVLVLVGTDARHLLGNGKHLDGTFESCSFDKYCVNQTLQKL